MEIDSFDNSPAPWLAVHPIGDEDRAAVAAMRAIVEPGKGLMLGTAARPMFDEIMGHVSAPDDVSYEADTVGGVPGWWCRPTNPTKGTILYLHGGWYVWGSAQAYRHLAGHVAARSGAAVFVADYRLAPEHPFPAAIDDAEACYRGLVGRGAGKIAIVGDSAGGGVGLALLARLAADKDVVVPAGMVALSPLTDLALMGRSWETRAEADPYFTRQQGECMAPLYLNGVEATNVEASPLYGELQGLPPIRVYVGDDEPLLDDSLRYVERAVAAGVDARVDVWQGMPHVFPSGVGQFRAADQALAGMGMFLKGTTL